MNSETVTEAMLAAFLLAFIAAILAFPPAWMWGALATGCVLGALALVLLLMEQER